MTRRAPSAVLLALLVASAACSDAERSSSATSGTYRRLTLSPADDAVELPSPTELAHFAGSQELGRVLSFEGRAALRHTSDSVLMKEGEPVLIGIPGPFPDDDLLRLSLTASGGGSVRLRARARAAGADLGRVTESKFLPQVEPREVELDFPGLHEARSDGGRAVERIEVEVKVHRGRLELHAVTVSTVPLRWRFPRGARDAMALVPVRGEMRRATCLTPGRALAARFDAEAGVDLVFSYVLPDELRTSGRAPVLELTLASGERVLERELSMPKKPDEPSTWAEERVPLDEFAGRQVAARFELRTPAGRPGVCALGEPALVRSGAASATVLLVTSDTHRADHVSGLPRAVDVETPTLAALASQGVSFLDAHSSTNNTTPSHAALFTGRHPRDTGLVGNGWRLADVAPTLAERFREAGFATLASISSSPVDPRMSGLGQGFDRFLAEHTLGVRNSSESIAAVLAPVDDYEGVPLFVWVHVFDAHAPYEPPEELADRYYPRDRDPRDASRDDALPELAPRWDPSIVDPGYTEALYRAEVTHLDRGLAELLEHPRFQHATIVFTADHGENLRHSDWPFDHRGLSPSTLEVPLIVRAPGLPAGAQVERGVRQIDVGRTLLDLVGLGESEFPGRNLLEALEREQGTSGPRFALEAYGLTASVRLGRWMLLLRLGLRAQERGREEELLHAARLYDVDADPYLECDLAGEHSETAAELRAHLVDWLVRTEDTGWSARSETRHEEVEEQLAALGYTTEEVARSERWIDPDCECQRCLEFR